MIYILATVFSTVLAWLSTKTDATGSGERRTASSLSTILLAASFLTLFVLSAIRYDVGTDYLPIYTAFFRSIANGATPIWDPGFLILNKAIVLYTDNPAWLFVITAAFTVGLTFRAIKKQSLNIPLSVLIFVIGGFYFTSMNAVRQWMAIALFLNAIPYIEKRDLKRYLLITALAASLHASALLYLPLYFAARLRINPRLAILLAGVSAAGAGVVTLALGPVIELTKYAWYATSLYSRADVALADVAIGGFVLAFSYWIRYRRGTNCDSDVRMDILINIQLFGTLVAVLSSSLFILGRVLLLMTAVQIFLIPAVLDRIESPLERAAYSVWLVGCYVGACWLLYGVFGRSEVLPYQTIFGAL